MPYTSCKPYWHMPLNATSNVILCEVSIDAAVVAYNSTGTVSSVQATCAITMQT